MGQIIKAEKIVFSYPGMKKKILNGCSLEIQQGEIISVLGTNGAGKSTLLNCMCGILNCQQGSITLGDRAISSMTRREISKIIGYVRQNQQLVFEHSVFEYVLMGRACTIGLFEKPKKKDYEIVTNILEQMGIAHLAGCATTRISGGEQQQAAIARAIAQEPNVIFFDEPTAHLDYGNQIATLRLINELKEKGFGIVMTTHNPDHCMLLGGKVAILNESGQLESGTCKEMLSEEKLKKLYHMNVKVVYVPETRRFVCIPGRL